MTLPASTKTIMGKKLPSQGIGGVSPEFVSEFSIGDYRVGGKVSSFDNALNFSRTGPATYTDATGTLQTVADGVPRTDHHIWDGSSWVNQGLLLESDAATNLLTYSEQFDNGAWGKDNVTVSANVSVAPNGTLTADKLIGTGSNPFITQSLGGADTSSHTISVYAKASELHWLRITNASAGNAAAWFNLADGVIGTVSGSASPTAGIVELSNGWYRCFITLPSFTPTTTATVFACTDADNTVSGYTGDGTSGIFIWGAQLEAGSTPTSYIKTEATTETRNAETLTASAGDLPEIPTQDVTNLLTYSEQFDNGVWGKTNATVTPNAGSAPNGAVTADKLVGNVGATDVRLSRTANNKTDDIYTFSNFLKAGEFSDVKINPDSSVANVNSVFDLSTGTFVSVGSAIIDTDVKPLSDGWFRVSLTWDQSARLNDSGVSVVGQTATGDGTSGIFIWGAQLEVGSDASAYVKTEATSVTATLPAPNASYSIQMEGTVSGTPSTMIDWQADASNLITLSAGASDFTFTQEQGGTVDSVTGGSYTSGINVPFNIASRHGATFINGAVDGTALSANTTPTALPDLTTTDLEIAPNFNGTIKLLRIWGSDIGDTGIAAASE